MIKYTFVVLVTLSLFVFTTPPCFAELTGPGQSDQEVYADELPSETDLNEEYDVALAPVVIVVLRIFATTALKVTKKQIQKGFTERAARSAVTAFNANKMRRIKESVCYVIEASGQTRVILSKDKSTILFAGTHEAYNTFVYKDVFKRMCRGKGVAMN